MSCHRVQHFKVLHFHVLHFHVINLIHVQSSYW